jgi:hypothetical protein
MILATYIPFYRIHEVLLYFVKNCEMISPSECWVFVDNVYHDKQKEILRNNIPASFQIFTGNWRNRSETWLEILRLASSIGEESVVVDSDNVLDDSFRDVYFSLKEWSVFTIMDYEAWNNEESRVGYMRRSKRAGELKLRGETRPLFLYKVFEGPSLRFFQGGSPFFIGPKQIVVFRKYPSNEIIDGVKRAIGQVDPWFRNFISDETCLGVLAYLMGIKEVAWTIGSHHHRHGSTPAKAPPVLVALAHLQFARGLFNVFHRKEFKYYALKYRLSLWKNLTKIIVK